MPPPVLAKVWSRNMAEDVAHLQQSLTTIGDYVYALLIAHCILATILAASFIYCIVRMWVDLDARSKPMVASSNSSCLEQQQQHQSFCNHHNSVNQTFKPPQMDPIAQQQTLLNNHQSQVLTVAFDRPIELPGDEPVLDRLKSNFKKATRKDGKYLCRQRTEPIPMMDKVHYPDAHFRRSLPSIEELNSFHQSSSMESPKSTEPNCYYDQRDGQTRHEMPRKTSRLQEEVLNEDENETENYETDGTMLDFDAENRLNDELIRELKREFTRQQSRVTLRSTPRTRYSSPNLMQTLCG